MGHMHPILLKTLSETGKVNLISQNLDDVIMKKDDLGHNSVYMDSVIFRPHEQRIP